MGRLKPEGVEDGDAFRLDGAWECLRETSQSILVSCMSIAGEPPEDLWIPQSQIHEDSEVYEKGTEGELIVTMWLAREREWCD